MLPLRNILNLNKPNIGILRVPFRLESKVPATGGSIPCEKKCVPPRLQKIKQLQKKYQAKECPVWRIGLMDKLLFYVTMTGCVAGPALAMYNFFLMI